MGNLAKISVFQQGVSTVHSDNKFYIVLYITITITIIMQLRVLAILDLPKLLRRYQPTGKTWLIDIYALLPQNLSFLFYQIF